jgi:hypothetical protein
MCGASDQQTDTYNEQQQFFQQMMQQQTQAWGEDQEVLAAIRGVSQPIFAAGPSQEGYSPEEKAAMETQVTEGTAQNYAKVATALGDQMAAAGGGNLAIPNGAADQIKAGVATSAAQEESREQSQITQNDWQQGYQNWLQAGQNMMGVAGQLNPVAYSGAATGAGSAASSTANQIAEESNSWINAAIGAAGAVGGGLIEANPKGIFD